MNGIMNSNNNVFSFNLFQLISPSVMVELLSKWLMLKEVCFLDTSMTSNALRLDFMHYLTGFKVTFSMKDCGHGGKSTRNLLSWTSTRQIYLDMIVIKHCTLLPANFIDICFRATEICIDNSSFFTDSNLAALIKSVPLLKILNIINCNQLSDTAFNDLSTDCRILNIESLTIKHCLKVTDFGLISFAKHCTKLTNFAVIHCNFTDKGINSILAITHRTLHTFRCERCPDQCHVENILRKMSELYEASETTPTLKAFTLSHSSFSTRNMGSINVGCWYPQVQRLERQLDGVVQLRVYEQPDHEGYGGIMRDDEFVLAVTYNQGDSRRPEGQGRVMAVQQEEKEEEKMKDKKNMKGWRKGREV